MNLARRTILGASWLLACSSVLSCSAEAPPSPADEREDEPLAEASSALVGYSCNEWSDTGYSNGKAFAITLVSVDGDPVERDTANAFLTLAQAAEGAGVKLSINSGFRTMAEQQYLYSCYKNCNCNSCNLAASPGYSNHQSGHAVDIASSDGYKWLFAHGPAYGWKNTVPSEKWHWEWWGGGPIKAFCPACKDGCEGNVLSRSDCSKTNCGDQDATCRHDAAGLRCEPNCHDRCEGNVLARSDCSKSDCGSGAVCREGGPGLRCDAKPRGSLDGVDAATLSGWAQDPTAPDTAIDVHFWINGPAGSPGATSLGVTAGQHRSDLCTAIGSCAHGFSRRTPRSLLDGDPHPIHAYGIDATGGENAQIGNSPRVLQEPPPALPPGSILRRVASADVFAAWKFSTFEDVAPLPDAASKTSDLMTTSSGPSFPTTPRLVTPDDGSSSAWMLDAGVRRRVSDPAAWRLGAPAAIDPVKLYQIPRGLDFPASPQLVRGVGPTDYVIDRPFLVATEDDTSEGGVDEGAGGHGVAPAGSSAGGASDGPGAVASPGAGSGCTAAGATGARGGLGGLGASLVALASWRRRRVRPRS